MEQIRLIYWRNKLAATTLNLAAGEAVTEIEVFEVQLNATLLDEALLRQIDKMIPYHILFVLSYEGRAQAWIGYKEAAASGSNAFKVSRYYHTEWMPENELQFRVDGLSMDAVYESLVRQIAGDALQADSGESLQASAERDEKRRQLEKQIAALESKMRKEKQLNRRMEINAELKKLKKELNTMSFSDVIGVAGLVVGIIGVIVGIIGCLCITKANEIKAKEINNSVINQAETLIVQNGVDTYAVIKLAQDTTKEELKSITDMLAATTFDLENLREEVNSMPKIFSGTGPPPEFARDRDIYIQYEQQEATHNGQDEI